MIVVDTTVLVKLLTGETGAQQARDRLLREDDRVAPDWIRVEIANVLVRKVRDEQFCADALPLALEAVPQLLTGFADTVGLLDHAVRLAVTLRHPVYDCLFLALAVQSDATLLTHDAAFARAARRGGHEHRVDLLA